MLNAKDPDHDYVIKEVLVAAFTLDTELFDAIDAEGTGKILLPEWLNFFRNTLRSKEEAVMGSGQEWVTKMVESLRAACLDAAELEAERAARAMEVEELMTIAEKAYGALATQNKQDEVLRKPELVKAHGDNRFLQLALAFIVQIFDLT